MFGFFFSNKKVENFDDSKSQNIKAFKIFFREMLNRGVYFASSPFETGFICTTMDEKVIDDVIKKAKEAMRVVKNEI